VDIDQRCEAEFACEAIGTTKGLSSEGGEVFDVFGLAGSEERPQQGIVEDAAVERFLKSVQRLIATCEFVQRWHVTIVRSGNLGVQTAVTPPSETDAQVGGAVLARTTSAAGTTTCRSTGSPSARESRSSTLRRPTSLKS